ncbi:MAG: TetR/AcrR family transcriptional regulator [Myxococcales bacterium]|nr:TetR/AcrR family transcriptional regulator [Myxococcales bacterium]
MPRPKLQSDDAVLEAARAVLRRRGPSDLTIQEVAREVGLSRAAIVQRFTNRETLLRRVMEKAVEDTRVHLASMPEGIGAVALWRFSYALCDVLGPGDRFAADVLTAWHEAQDPELRALSAERYHLVCAAIAARVPRNARLDPEGIAELLHAVIAGATMQWGITRRGRLDDFVRARLRAALSVLFPRAALAEPPSTLRPRSPRERPRR